MKALRIVARNVRDGSRDRNLYLGIPEDWLIDIIGVYEEAEIPLAYASVFFVGDDKHALTVCPAYDLVAYAEEFAEEDDTHYAENSEEAPGFFVYER